MPSAKSIPRSNTPACTRKVGWSDGGEIASISGQAAGLLTGERVALNFLMHLSGVATAAANAVKAIEGTGVQILDTRKTTPGMRALEKAAVAAGGATNHRAGLYDAILIKENHIAAAGGIAQAIERCRAGSDLPLEIEVRNEREIDEALKAGANHLLLDNMNNQELKEAVSQVAGLAKLEAIRRISPGQRPRRGRDRGRLHLDGFDHARSAGARPVDDHRRLIATPAIQSEGKRHSSRRELTSTSRRNISIGLA